MVFVYSFFFFLSIYLFICLRQLLAAACGIQFPAQRSKLGPLLWECGVLTTGPPGKSRYFSIFFFFNLFLFIYFFGCVGSSFLCEGFLQLRQVGATLHRGARASHYLGLSCCRAQAPDAQAQQLWLTGPAAPRHVGSSQTRARTRVPRIGRQILNHCATGEALLLYF